MNIAVNPVRSSDSCEVAIIGAGPYGLAVAAHLRAVNVSIRVFGEVMSFWRRNMPQGMKLRSPWIATHIADPFDRYLLDDYFREAGLHQPDLLPVKNFIGYGTWFQERAVPDLDTRAVVEVAALDGGFRLALDDGKNFFARRVVMATGLLDHEHRPAQFDAPAARFGQSFVRTYGFRPLPRSPCRGHRPRTKRMRIGCAAARGGRACGDHLPRTFAVERRPGSAR